MSLSANIEYPVSILKPKIVSAGLSVCRVKSGEIVMSAHEGNQHIILEMSIKEFEDFTGQLAELCKQLRENRDADNG